MKKFKIILLFISTIFLFGFLIPERIKIPVENASKSDWHPASFWYEPWGTSGVHKGIDIFGKLGTNVVSAVDGLVVYLGQSGKGGNAIIVLGPKWRFHYYAHLKTINTTLFSWVASGQAIGTLGNTGNAKGKPPHLHYSIARLIPAPWAIDRSTQGHKKAFYMDPNLYLGGWPEKKDD